MVISLSLLLTSGFWTDYAMANRADPYQTALGELSDQGLHCLQYGELLFET